jgi:hypothetical protein
MIWMVCPEEVALQSLDSLAKTDRRYSNDRGDNQASIQKYFVDHKITHHLADHKFRELRDAKISTYLKNSKAFFST